MPGNGVGDRVHNFFAQENLSQGPRGDGNWPLNDNLWVGNQKQFAVSDSGPRNYNPQQSEPERGHGSQRVDPHLFNLTQTRPDFPKSQPQSNSNGFMYQQRQNFQTPPNEANFMGVESEYNNRNNMNQRGFPFYESQQEQQVPEEPPKNPFRPEPSEPHSGFDLFGGQSQSQPQTQQHHQMNNNNQYPNFMQQPLQQQQQFGDIQQLQQQLMLRKMQELQRQELQKQELQRQEEFQRQQQQQHQRQQQASLFARQASGSHMNGGQSQTSDWAEAAVNTNWLQRPTPQVQGNSGGLAFSPEQSQSQSQPQRSMGFVGQQVDQSLYGVPVSRNQFPQNPNQFPGNHFVIPSQGQIIKPQQNVAQDLFGSTVEDKSGNSEAALDPDEEKILFGSDDTNIWEAFGTSKSTGGGVSSLLEDNEFGSGLPSSLQSGSWSALMQSAVAETVSSGTGAQEEWPDLNFQNPVNAPSPASVPVPDITAMNMNQSKQKGMPGHWTAQQLPNNNPRFNMNEDHNSLQQADWKRVMNNGVGQGGGISGINPGMRNNVNQFTQNNNSQVNYWKNVDAKSKGSENSKVGGPQVSESSFNSSDKEDLKMENSNDSYRSSSSHLPNSFGQGQRETFSDAGDSRMKQQSLPNQGNRKVTAGGGGGSRKFQYHPMGNLDEDVGMPYGRTTQSVGNFGHVKVGGQQVKSSELGKEVEGVPKGPHDMRFKGMIPGHVPHDRAVGLSTSDKSPQPSQNMLELLHKVDQSRDRGNMTRQMNNNSLSSEIPEPENSDGSFGGQQRSQSSNSQGIGLQLGPPSQRIPMPNHAQQRAMQTVVKPNPMSQNIRGKGPTNMSPFPSFQETSHTSVSGQSQTASEHKMVTNFSAALGADFSRSQFQNQQTVNNRGQVLPESGHVSQMKQVDESRVRSLNANLYEKSNERIQGEKFPASQVRGVSPQVQFPKMLPNTWSNLPSQQLFSGSQPRKPHQIQSNLATSHPLNIVESTSLSQQNIEEQKQSMKESPLVDPSQMVDGPGGNDLSSQNASLEAFGRSLKPNNLYSLPNQMKSLIKTENDPSKRMKMVPQQVGPWSGQPREHATVPPQESEIPQNVVSKEVSEQNGSQSQTLTSVKAEHSHVTPQSGMVKPGQMMPAVKTVEQRVSGSVEVHDKEVGSAVPDPSQAVVIPKLPPVVPLAVTPEQLPSIPLLQNSVIVRPKKRKFSPCQLHPFVKEVTGACKNVHDICAASMEWCGVANRLMEKVEDDGEVIEDVPKPKRRIIATTQLIQQLFPPPPVTILTSDASLDYESVAFYAARLSLGDACNLVSSRSSSSSDDTHTGSDPQPDKNKETNDHCVKVVEDCISKSKKLENDFSRLDKRASILDLRVECQDLEKFSIINRFAKFHGRGQTEGESSSSSEALNTPKPFPQRYVIAVPLPKNLPERVQCLSL